MKSTLDDRDGHLCVLNESEPAANNSHGPLGTLREWYSVREATEGEVARLVGRPVNGIEREKACTLMKRVIPTSFRSREELSLLRSR
jgi:hypothetical protein